MNRKLFLTAAFSLLGLAGAASADTFINIGGNGNHASVMYPNGSRDQWAAAQAGYNIVSASNFTANGFSFAGVSDATVSSNDGGSFYLGTAASLQPINAQNTYFDSGDANDYIGNGTYDNPGNPDLQVLAFGNSTYTANSLTINFVPGIRSFGFNWEDVGDVGSLLRVEWSDHTTQLVELGVNTMGDPNRFNDPAHDGFFGVIQSGGNTLLSMTFVQHPGQNNDGFSLYGFQASMVPIPTAAYAGLAGLGLVYVANRRRKARAT